MAGGPRPEDAVARARARSLLDWFATHRRPLPWRSDRDPYRIWVAEVLLQQTRVAQAGPYFERFVRRFPTVRALARAGPSEVLRVWAGAGYYARARHLHAAARRLVAERGGALPDAVGELQRLPGIGPYIARAIASLAFGRPVVALEANGLRVAARWTAERGDPRRPEVRRRLEATLAAGLPAAAPGDFNEAVMELGETVCTPVAPRCPVCPVARHCGARRTLADPGKLPLRPPRPPRPLVRGAVVVVEDPGGRWLMQRRAPRGLLGGLWEFPGGKIEGTETPAAAARRELREETGLRLRAVVPLGVVRHAYSHFAVELHVFRGAVREPGRRSLARDRRWVAPGRAGALPLPRATREIVRRLRARGRASPGSGSRPGRTSVSSRRARRPPRRRAPRRGTAASSARSRARR